MKGARHREARFWAKVNKITGGGCWLWTGSLNAQGYGLATFKHEERDRWLAHRLAYTLTNGTIPEGLTLDHTCRVRCCVNPEHLEPVTKSENTDRMWRAGGRAVGRPRKNRMFRVEDELWDAAMATADARGEYLSEAIREMLGEYVAANEERKRKEVA